MNYRPELDGLRAIAVVSVILYHAQITIFGHQLFQGGFIGVDIFFVISGYLITSIIYKELDDKKTFSFSNFYYRRFKRIIPILVLVTATFIPLSILFLLPFGLIDFSKSILYSYAFISNLYFFLTSNYWNDELIKPFLHTWSLSIEEQFYILFPIVIFFVYRYLKKYLNFLLVIAFLTSLLFSEWASYNHTSFNYYFLPSRAWEILSGSILAIYENSRKKNLIINEKKYLFSLLSILGLFLVLIPIFYFNKNFRHPSLISLIPVLGTCILISCSNKNWVSRKILSNSFMVKLGLMSYSLYMWHYPIFEFQKIIFNKFNDLYFLPLVFIVSYLSYNFYEKKIRSKNFSFKKTMYLILSMATLVILILVFIISNEGLKKRIDNKLKNYPNIIINHDILVKQRYSYKIKIKDELSKNISSQNKVNVLILGDSYGENLFYSLYANKSFFPEYNFKMHLYKESDDKKLIDQLFEKNDYIILNFRWHKLFPEGIREKNQVIQFLKSLYSSKYHQKVLLASNYTEFKMKNSHETILDYEILRNDHNLNKIDNLYFLNKNISSNSIVNQIIKNVASELNIKYLNHEDYQCQNNLKSCFATTPDGFKIYIDSGHLTVEGAVFFGKQIVKKNWLSFL